MSRTKHPASKAIESMEAVSALMEALFTPNTNIIDVDEAVKICSFENYTDFGDGVSARLIHGKLDCRTDDEAVALPILAAMSPPLGHLMFIRMEYPGGMINQRHPQFEHGWVLSGELIDLATGRRWSALSYYSFARMVEHEPVAGRGGCFLLGRFTN